MIKKLLSGKWQADVQPGGRGRPRVRKTFATKAAAKIWETAQHYSYQVDGTPPMSRDSRTVADLVELWYEHHGLTLKDGIRRRRCLLAMAAELGNPVAQRLAPTEFLRYRSRRGQAINPATHRATTAKSLNNHLGYLRAVYCFLRRQKMIGYDDPLRDVRPIPQDQRELAYLTGPQVVELLEHIRTGSQNCHVYLLTKICLATGARWGEAEALTPERVRDGLVTYAHTKSGRTRSVPISPDLQAEIEAHFARHGPPASSIGAFRRASARCSFALPRGQSTHVLRHTFASHFIGAGGNILALQRILGHSTIEITMRYAHLAPDHLQQAVTYNPLPTPPADVPLPGVNQMSTA